MTTSKRVLNTLYLILLCILIVLGLGFEAWSDGFSTLASDGTLILCNTTAGSGADDAVITTLFVLYIFPLGFRLMRLKTPPQRSETFLFFGIALILIVAFFKMAGCADIGTTLITQKNPWLIALFIAWTTSADTLLRISRKPR